MARPHRLSGDSGDQGHVALGRSSLHNSLQAAHNGHMTPRIPPAVHPDSTDSPDPRPKGSAAGTSNPTDLARRVTHRRQELGLTTEELAQRAGVDPTYLRYFERSADARLSFGTLNLIALILDTTPTALAGGDIDRPPGRGRAGRHPSLETLTREQCDTHLATGGVGRVIYSTERGPVALPVNFEFTGGEVILSTDVGKADHLEKQFLVGFEIDRVDEALSEGWSVLVSGPARIVDDPEEIVRLSSLDVEAWAGGERHALVKITPDTVTGRVIVHHSDPDED
jgi:nitroimidazol reductase NimA-like FMN-containing flavoprotein (pyridoxamine 5'-phosphate oxidase superfamily)